MRNNLHPMVRNGHQHCNDKAFHSEEIKFRRIMNLSIFFYIHFAMNSTLLLMVHSTQATKKEDFI